MLLIWESAAKPFRSGDQNLFLDGGLTMAPADVARASTGTDFIKGLAQSIAKPAYRRLLVAEPALRRAVPLLIITFLITMAVGTGVQVFDHRRQALVAVNDELKFSPTVSPAASIAKRQPPRMQPASPRRRSTACSIVTVPAPRFWYLMPKAP